jgi:hypothetical protein
MTIVIVKDTLYISFIKENIDDYVTDNNLSYKNINTDYICENLLNNEISKLTNDIILNINNIIITSNYLTKLPNIVLNIINAIKIEIIGNLFYEIDINQLPNNIIYLDIHNITNINPLFFEKINNLEKLEIIQLNEQQLSFFPDFSMLNKLHTIIIHIENYILYNDIIRITNKNRNNEINQNKELKELFKSLILKPSNNIYYLFQPLYDISDLGIMTIYL